MADLALFALGLLLFISLLLALGVCADSWDARERRAARRRNQAHPWSKR